MVKKTTKTATKKATSTVAAKKSVPKAVKKTTKTKKVATRKSNTVDYYPNRMTFWTSFAAVVILVFLALLIAINIKYF